MNCKVTVKLLRDDNDNGIGFGKGIVMLLEGVEKFGSINQATHAMGMAYSKAWRIIRATEDEFGVKLLTRDGAKGSSLTPDSRKLMELYYSLLEHSQNAAKELISKTAQ